MELHEIRAFVVVASCVTLTDAADRLHIAQPALSRKMQKLERDLGFALFKRCGPRLELTDSGKAFLYDAADIAKAYDRAVANVRRLGTVRPRQPRHNSVRTAQPPGFVHRHASAR